jgi:hypothetical protein
MCRLRDEAGRRIAAAMEHQREPGELMPTTRITLPRVHVAGSDAHIDAYIEVGSHGFALFLAGADYPMLDIDGTPQQLDEVVRGLQAALASRV